MTPTSDEQIRFLINLQRLLAEGQFVATYKFALLLALAEISIEQGNDSGDSLSITTRTIAKKFIQYYWRQAAPFPTREGAQVLQQNTGTQAAVVQRLQETRSQRGISLAATLERTDLASAIDEIVRKMPLWKLQTVGREQVEFLYPNVGHGTQIELFGTATFCFRRFYELISELVRGAWLRNVRQQNLAILGEEVDLGEFLFGSERANLGTIKEIVAKIQGDRCFYCGDALKASTTEVDHFISWARYPVDLGHNFVLADKRCNNKKRDRLPAVEHLVQWVKRNQLHSLQLADDFERHGLPANLRASVSVVCWAYAQTETAQGLTWTRGDELVPLSSGWQRHLVPLLDVGESKIHIGR